MNAIQIRKMLEDDLVEKNFKVAIIALLEYGIGISLEDAISIAEDYLEKN